MAENFINRMLNDLKTELLDEFDMNFRRKAFFDRPWPETKYRVRRGSLMMRSGALRRSVRAQVVNTTIPFTSSLPYASIHNEGGSITVTRRMQKYFWAMYYETAGRLTYSVRQRAVANSASNRMISDEASYWKAMALKPVGSRLKVPERRFIGAHPQVDKIVSMVVDDTMRDVEQYIKNRLKP
jgi:phage gpG-like protein